MDFVYPDADKGGTADTTESSVAYLYASGRLSGINTATTAYTITYDAFGNMVSVSAGSNVLATYTYKAGNGKLTRMTYGNGEYEEYTYDNLDRLVKVTYNGSDENAFTVVYDSNGRLAKAVDGKVGITYLYEYDSLDRLIRAYQKDASGNTIFAVENSYDEYGRAKGSKITSGTTAHNYGVSYVEGTNLLDSHTMPNGKVHDYSYDKFDRLTWKSHFSNSFWTQYAYYKNGNNTTPLISTFEFCDGNCDYETYTYTYDVLGNITAIRKNGSLVCSYEYDALGQLTRENNAAANFSVLYGYDKSGNITWRSEFPYSTGVLSAPAGDLTLYTYGNSQWKDLLTNYDGTNISYDAIGNPTNWVGIVGIEWNGRQLTYLTKDGLDHGVGFTYNADGIRTKKVLYDYDGTVTTHNYVLDGTNIIKETITSGSNTDILEYYYDEAGIAGFEYNGTKYYYVKNIQGDVIEICNTSGISVVSYTYDAWGNILSITGSLASTVGQINPFRYRGYYYDSETDLYYLNSRYYDAEVGRFINADAFIGANGGLQGYNMFAYCNNSPVMFYDPSGCMGEVIEENFDNNDPFDLFPECMDGGCGSGYYFSFSNATYSSLYSGGIYYGNGSFGYTTPGVYSSYSAYKNTTAYNEAFYNSPYNINVTPSYSASSSETSSGVAANKVHGNSKNSTNSQHLYAIYYEGTGKVAKIGISGNTLNQNGTSRRANSQVNSWNKDAGDLIYKSVVLVKNIPGRSAALELERIYAEYFREEGHPMDRHKRP